MLVHYEILARRKYELASMIIENTLFNLNHVVNTILKKCGRLVLYRLLAITLTLCRD